MSKKVEGKVLGKKVAYPKNYNPEILVAVPRSENRLQYNIMDTNLPFVGFDSWHAYEIGFLTHNGLPVSGVLKLVYPCNNKFLVESKSLKLYLNSFNHEKLGNTKTEAINAFLKTVKTDLTNLLNVDILLHFFENEPVASSDFSGFTKLEEESFVENLVFEHHKENPEILKVIENRNATLKVYSDLLRSNCKITNQPDWGSIFIYLKGEKYVDKASLLSYIVSFRNENHFHEEVCEMIYKRLWDFYLPQELMVACLYTRRGGIDICPSRASHVHLLPHGLTTASQLSKLTFRQ